VSEESVDSIAAKFSAAASAAGYIYQARLALAEALRFAYSESGVEIGIERFDDVSFEKDGEAIEVLQTKHHVAKAGDLSDGSPDLWKTLRIWCEKVRADPSLPSRLRFTLVTTGAAPDGSAASHLRPQSASHARDEALALSKLRAAAATSENRSLRSAFAAFADLVPEMQVSLLRAVNVLDRSPNVANLERVIEDHLRMIAPRGKSQAAREQIEGWWWSRIAKALQEPNVSAISIMELEARLDDIREVMKRDALPIDEGDTELGDDQLQALDEMTFVKQLRSVRLGAARIDLAKRDFYRASTQRSRWTRENLVFDGEIGQFEKALIEEWQPRFFSMCDGLESGAEAGDIRRAGQRLYHWVEAEARFAFRNVSQRFLSVGSYNMLANDVRVGWHRDFVKTFGKKAEG
jgi:hypothetical protein